MQEIGSNAKVAYERLSTASNEEKNDALHFIANEIENNEEYILSENNKDIQSFLRKFNAKIKADTIKPIK